jgi:hypothetical protein
MVKHLAVMVVVMSVGAHAAEPSKLSEEPPAAFTYKGMRWGISMDEVRKARPKAKQMEGEDALYVDEETGSSVTTLFFAFAGGQLGRISLMFNVEHSNKTDFLSDFDRLADSLTQKYGFPARSEYRWKNELFRPKQSDWGLAVAVGHLERWASWELDDTTITLKLTGDNHEIRPLMVDYVSKKHRDAFKAQREKKKLEDL